MRKSDMQIEFNSVSSPTTEESKNGNDPKQIQIEFLPCTFQKNIEDTNKHIYFDPLVKPVEGELKEKTENKLWETSL